MFTEYKKLSDLENAYDVERKKLYDHFLYLKHKLNYSEAATIKMTRIIEAFDGEMNQRIRHQEMKLEDDKDTLRRDYLKQSARIEGDE